MRKNLVIGLIMATGIFTGCNSHKPENIKARATEYMKDKSQIELDMVLSPINRPYAHGCHHAQTQSKLDSVAFRDVFEATNALKDSTLISEFNQIAKKAEPPTITESTMKLKNNLRNTKIRVKDYSEISTNHSKKLFQIGENVASEYLQFIADSINYHNFFEKHNLFDAKTQELFHNSFLNCYYQRTK